MAGTFYPGVNENERLVTRKLKVGNRRNIDVDMFWKRTRDWAQISSDGNP